MGQCNVSISSIDGKESVIFYHLGLHFGQAHPCGPGHDLPVHQAQQWHLGPGGDQADSWQLQHHPLLQVQGHGDCTGSLPGTENIELEYNIIMTIFDRFMRRFFITKVSWVSIETSPIVIHFYMLCGNWKVYS